MVTNRLATGVIVSISVAVLFVRLGSVTPLGAVTVAVFLMLPDVPTVPVTMNVTDPPLGSIGITMPAPCISATVVFATVGHDAPPVAVAQVTPVTVRFATAGSWKIDPFAALGPVFDTTTVYVVVLPALTLLTPSVLLIAKSACGVSVSVSVELLLLRFGSVTPLGAVTVAVFTRLPTAP